MPYNLESPNGLLEPIDMSNVARWYVKETLQIEPEAIRHVLHHVATNLNDFVRWPARATLLWQGCDRARPERGKQKYHRYPEILRKLAKERGIYLDTRPNGPATAAFLFAGGVRPERFGSSNAWSIHHLYSGKFPYIGLTETLHAVKDCNHFTQSAGLIATHPIADQLCDEFPFFAWVLRAKAYELFRYDPNGVFSAERDNFGFLQGHTCEVVVPMPSTITTAARG